MTFGVAYAVPTDDETQLIKIGHTGDEVQLIQSRLSDLRFFEYKITNFYGEFTKSAVTDFQAVNGLTSDGVVGMDTMDVLFGNEAKSKPVKAVVKPTPRPKAKSSGSSSRPSNVKKLDWFKSVKGMVRRGDKFKLYDVYSGRSYYGIMVGGYNHIDYEPAKYSDTAIMKSTYGGTWSWDRRPIIATIDGIKIAASTNGKPHGYETIGGNGMDGQVCLHFYNSRTHGLNIVDASHQAAVRVAAR